MGELLLRTVCHERTHNGTQRLHTCHASVHTHSLIDSLWLAVPTMSPGRVVLAEELTRSALPGSGGGVDLVLAEELTPSDLLGSSLLLAMVGPKITFSALGQCLHLERAGAPACAVGDGQRSQGQISLGSSSEKSLGVINPISNTALLDVTMSF